MLQKIGNWETCDGPRRGDGLHLIFARTCPRCIARRPPLQACAQHENANGGWEEEALEDEPEGRRGTGPQDSGPKAREGHEVG